MARFHGNIGFVHTEETAPGVNSEVVVPHNYYGDVIRNTRRWENTGTLNDSPVVNNQFSIVGNDFAYKNFSAMRYVEWQGTLWKITNIEVQRPRLILTVGGVYNAP
jgi:hypothetical protein